MRQSFFMALPQEKLVGVRSVNLDMTGGALLEFRVEQVVVRRLYIHALVARARAAAVMTFQAEREDHRTRQQFRVSRAVRIVARLAALHAHTRMLVDERSAL